MVGSSLDDQDKPGSKEGGKARDVGNYSYSKPNNLQRTIVEKMRSVQCANLCVVYSLFDTFVSCIFFWH